MEGGPDALVMSNTTIATEESRMYEGMSERKRSFVQATSVQGHVIEEVELRTCPAVSQSCSRTVRSSRYIVLLKKSIPIVAWYVLSNVSYINLRTRA